MTTSSVRKPPRSPGDFGSTRDTIGYSYSGSSRISKPYEDAGVPSIFIALI